MRQRIFDLVGPARDGDYASRAYDIFIVFIAIISLAPMLFDPTKTTEFESGVLWILDIVTAYILLFDYVLRWMTHDIKTDKGWKAFLIYPFTPMAIIDILAILPTLNLVPQALRFLRILRVVKVFRYSKNLLVVTNACKREGRTLASVFVAVVVYMLVVALIIFNVEPESFNNYFDAVCWACTAMTSVSFSDSRPAGYVGKALSILSSLVALLVVALPAGVITGAYINEVRESKKNGSRYFEMAGRMNFKLRKFDSPAVWLHKNRKILRYIVIIVSSVALNLVLTILLIAVDCPIWLNTLCVALTAFLLEPAAGIIVAFIAAIIATLFQADTTSMLFFFSYAVIALAFGLVFPRENSNHKALRILFMLFLLFIVCGIIQGGIYLLKYDWDAHAAIEVLIAKDYSGIVALHDLGMPDLPNLLLGNCIDQIEEMAPMVILFVILVKKFGVRAAPSEKELKQQQDIIIQRALEREDFENEEAQKIAKESLEHKYRNLCEQQEQIESERKAIKCRIDEMNNENNTANQTSTK